MVNGGRIRFAYTLILLSPVFGSLAGCTVQIQDQTNDLVPPLSVANAVTERHGASPNGVTLTYIHTIDSNFAVSPEQAVTATSNGDQWSAHIDPPSGTTFQPWDELKLIWRVTFDSLGQPADNTATNTIYIDFGMTMQFTSDFTVGGSTTGIVRVAHPRTRDTTVDLRAIGHPRDTILTVSPDTVLIPSQSTTSSPFTVASQPNPNSPGTPNWGVEADIRLPGKTISLKERPIIHIP